MSHRPSSPPWPSPSVAVTAFGIEPRRWVGAVLLALAVGCGAVPSESPADGPSAPSVDEGAAPAGQPGAGAVAAASDGLRSGRVHGDRAGSDNTVVGSVDRTPHPDTDLGSHPYPYPEPDPYPYPYPSPGSRRGAPICAGHGRNAEGWYDAETGTLLRRARCRGCEAVCDAVGSRSEGWYSSCDGTLVQWERCGGHRPPRPGSEGSACGGRGSARCQSGLVCAFEPFECNAPGATGTCRPALVGLRCAPPRPGANQRVCGCDGHTYVDACHARAANVSIAAYGSCEPDVEYPTRAPECRYVGTRSEGWYDGSTGERIGWAQCGGCEAVCDAVGSRSEGWYSSCDGRLIQWDQCSAAPWAPSRPH